MKKIESQEGRRIVLGAATGGRYARSVLSSMQESARMKLGLVALGGLLVCALALAQTPESKPDLDKLLDKLTFTKDKASLPYRLLKPDGYDKDGKDRYPLVVFLHGGFGRGTDNKSHSEAASRTS
jgi:poly(3-hydroxybutyrate) depolymerase